MRWFFTLHVHGSSNPLGITGNLDRLPMHGYFVFKDLVTIFVFMIFFSFFVFFSPNTMGHPDNYIPDRSIIRGKIGECHVEVPFILMGQIATIIYFGYFIVIVPIISTIENVLFYIGRAHV
ncbi:uncharacterized protein SCODWIG_03983 [Saccharomycodes ludwigii]|uniref:Cytochrome b n=1 Tax=Saccharomycodes ludwigii TaxID=36035 RepID=A0A376BCA2_9ASCO|nr:uncharacterized protein SCODWIG_03983 [Saccharomycodes ludwigii]